MLVKVCMYLNIFLNWNRAIKKTLCVCVIICDIWENNFSFTFNRNVLTLHIHLVCYFFSNTTITSGRLQCPQLRLPKLLLLYKFPVVEIFTTSRNILYLFDVTIDWRQQQHICHHLFKSIITDALFNSFKRYSTDFIMDDRQQQTLLFTRTS